MVGDEHRRYRNVVQPMFLRPKVASWWKTSLIDDAVATLLDRVVGRDACDLNVELCARLRMHVVTRGIGMSVEAELTLSEPMLGTENNHAPIQESAKWQGEDPRTLHALPAKSSSAPVEAGTTGISHKT